MIGLKDQTDSDSEVFGARCAKVPPLCEEEMQFLRSFRGGTVYLISQGDLIRVGFSRYVANRVPALIYTSGGGKIVACAEGDMFDGDKVRDLLSPASLEGWYTSSKEDALAAMRKCGLRPRFFKRKTEADKRIEQLESHLSAAAYNIKKLRAKIARLTKQIKRENK